MKTNVRKHCSKYQLLQPLHIFWRFVLLVSISNSRKPGKQRKRQKSTKCLPENANEVNSLVRIDFSIFLGLFLGTNCLWLKKKSDYVSIKKLLNFNLFWLIDQIKTFLLGFAWPFFQSIKIVNLFFNLFFIYDFKSLKRLNIQSIRLQLAI